MTAATGSICLMVVPQSAVVSSDLVIRFSTSSLCARREGMLEMTRAAVPAAHGVAIDVPLIVARLPSSGKTAGKLLVMYAPGAAMSTPGARLAKSGRVLSLVLAVTDRRPFRGKFAGYSCA